MIFSTQKKSLKKSIKIFFLHLFVDGVPNLHLYAFQVLNTIPLIATNWCFKERFREMSIEHVHFRNIILPVFISSVPIK